MPTYLVAAPVWTPIVNKSSSFPTTTPTFIATFFGDSHYDWFEVEPQNNCNTYFTDG